MADFFGAVVVKCLLWCGCYTVGWVDCAVV